MTQVRSTTHRLGSPSRNRTEVSRIRAGRSPIELKGGDWSGCGVLPTGLRVPSAGLFLHELHPVNSGAHERIRTPIFSSCYGYPVRSRARLRARIGSGRRVRTCRVVINNHPRPPRAPDRKRWWSNGVTLPARRSCKDRLHPCACPLVPGRGFEPRSPALQAGAFTRSAFRAIAFSGESLPRT